MRQYRFYHNGSGFVVRVRRNEWEFLSLKWQKWMPTSDQWTNAYDEYYDTLDLLEWLHKDRSMKSDLVQFCELL